MASFSFSGLASGLDTGSIVSALVNVERQPINRIQKQQTNLSSRQTKYEQMRTMLNELKTAAEGLNDLNSILTVNGTSSQETAFTVSGNGSTPQGGFDVRIERAATAERTYSAGFSDRYSTGLFGTGTLSITIGDDDTVDFEVDGETTLASLASDINASDADVTAGIMFDGTNYRLMITGNRTGETDGAITFAESGTSLGLYDPTDSNQYQAAQSALIYVDGFERTSESNTIADAIPGATIEVLGATTDTARATFRSDPEGLTKKLQAFVDKYNSVYGKINAELTSRAETGSASVSASLNGDTTMRTVQQRLSRAITTPASGETGTFTTLGELGVSVDRTGTLSLNATKLEEALARDPESVAKVLMDDTSNGSTGVMANMISMLEGLTDRTDGFVSNRINGITSRKRDLDDQIARMELHISTYEDQLNRQFTAMETMMANLQAQGNQLAAILGGL